MTTNTNRPAYTVAVVSPNSWHVDGSPIIECECRHVHRTLTGAHRCLRDLTRTNPDGTTSARWYRAHVRNIDGSQLSADDAAKLEDIRREQDWGRRW